MGTTGGNAISAELLEAARNAEAAEAHRNWAQMLASRVASGAAIKRRKPTAMNEGEDPEAPGSSLQHPLGLPPIIQGFPASLPGRTLAMPPGCGEYGVPIVRTSAPALPDPMLLYAKEEADDPQSAPPSDSDGDTPAGGSGRRTRGTGGRFRGASDPQSRAEATKEKNRRAQQRFRHKQKTRMEALEAEVARLRALLAERGIDPGSGIEEASTPLAVLTVEQMYTDLESWLDDCPGLARPTAVRFLQAWLSEMSEDARRLHYKSIQKRQTSGKKEDVALWVTTQAESHGSGATMGAGGTEHPPIPSSAPNAA